ncbi:MAG: HAMP domain-containing sensor histidine kinase [Bacteroidota bacterium]|nr:HAMP domain-containing sensor histidine kinase [Bacteroidota bacterium]
MKEIQKYIRTIIVLSSISLFGFLIIQYYWAKNNFEEKKLNIQNVISICNQEIIEEIEDLIVEKSTKLIIPKSFSSINSINNNIHDEKTLVDSLVSQLELIEDENFMVKRKTIIDIVNRHLSLNINFDLDQLLDEEELIEIIDQVMDQHNLNLEYFYSITNSSGLILFSNFEKKENELLINSTIFSDEFLIDDIYNERKIFSLYIMNLEKSIIRSFSSIFLISISLITIVIGTFFYSIKIINNQKKITQIKSDFINNMTHELKTPIATIGLACEALKDKDIELNKPMKDKFLSTITNENERLGKLVETVLQNTISDKGTPELKLEIFNIEEIIEKAMKSIQLSFDKKEGSIETDFMALNKIVEADKLHITNVIYNLLDNSLKYSENKPHVKISTRDVIGGLVIRIKDNGIGIAKDNQEKIFEKLFRVPTGNIHNVKGFGLGLSYVKSIMELHQGSIKVESKLGYGSTFLISLKASKIIES